MISAVAQAAVGGSVANKSGDALAVSTIILIHAYDCRRHCYRQQR